MMKTTLIIISSVFFALGLSGCKEEAPKAPEAPAVSEPAPLPPAAPTAEPVK